tara:strand:- start:7354 stop:8307 length:954 start_codon:yes stop_codon:yes gene_type:complete
MRGTVGASLVVLLFTASLSGCTAVTDAISGNDSADVPVWEVGDWWLYTFSTPEYTDDTARLVVASVSEESGTANMLAISSLTEARRHAVLNHNPFLGRITHEDLAAFENGVAQPVMEFPLEKDNSWEFTLFSIEWQASVIDLSSDYVTIRADSDDGGRIDYVYDRSAGFFSSFIWKDSAEIEQMRMMLADNGEGHTGDVYFVRGGDLYSDTWEDTGPDIEIRDTFFVSGHPNDGEWDEMIYFLDAECGTGSSSITLTLRDHFSVSALERVWGPGASEYGTLGTIPYPSEEYTLTATFTGDTYLRIRIAGGITSSWTL